ncbi:MAG: hypothetical protein F6K00_33710 [Leptolyngbya sp. SIOISBB]|nr:hypothetical protein [Leptolyngbya sp. SIOISBB]
MRLLKRLIEVVLAIAFAALGCIALSQSGGLQFAAGFAVAAIALAIPLKSWQKTWRFFGGTFRWSLILLGLLTLSI